MNPILIDVPTPISTPRLTLRPPQSGDGKIINAAIRESFDQLARWMPWAAHKPNVDESEIFVRTAQARWILREELTLFIFDRQESKLLGATSFHHINWDLPSFEIGYWVRSTFAGQGIITESTNCLTRYAFEQLGAVRVEIKSDEQNKASRRVAEKLHFHLEGILLRNAVNPANKKLRNTVIYACYSTSELPALKAQW